MKTRRQYYGQKAIAATLFAIVLSMNSWGEVTETTNTPNIETLTTASLFTYGEENSET